jgi:hypothetical protein
VFRLSDRLGIANRRILGFTSQAGKQYDAKKCAPVPCRNGVAHFAADQEADFRSHYGGTINARFTLSDNKESA